MFNDLNIYIPAISLINPFIIELVNSLKNRPEVRNVNFGLEKLYSEDIDFDVVIFQWPEVLIKWEEATEDSVDFVRNKIIKWKKAGIKLFATVHNERPHAGANKYTFKLYKLIYDNCDAVIHLGEESIKVLRENINYSKEVQNIVIPHGNYNFFPNYSDRNSARTHLNFSQKKWIFLIFGHIRNKEERNIIITLSKILKKYNGEVVVAGKLLNLNNNRRRLVYYWDRKDFFLSSNISLFEGFIPNEDLHLFLNASDVLFIPRIKSLNSGNVALGFTFGKIVIGQDYGVIGEDLKRNNNPVFNSGNIEDLEKVVDKAFELRHSKLGLKNKNYAQNELDWSNIASKYLQVISKTL